MGEELIKIKDDGGELVKRKIEKEIHDEKEKEEKEKTKENKDKTEQAGKESKEDEKEKDSESKKDVEMTEEERLAADLDIMEGTECKFNVNNYKMVFVLKSESYLYRRNSVKKARLVRIIHLLPTFAFI